MNQREKVLAGAVIALVVIYAGNSWYGKYRAAVAKQRGAVADAEASLADVNLALAEGRSALQKLETWQVRSLPDNRERALSLYKAWLLAAAKDAGLTVNDLKPTPRVITSASYQSVGYQMEATGSLSTVVALLYEFYRSPILHQITNLRLTRPLDGSALQVSLEVEALSVPGAVATDSLPEGESNRLALASLADYQKSLSERDLANVYAPPQLPRDELSQAEESASAQAEEAAQAKFTAVVGGGQGLQAWINVPSTGETLRLVAGDLVKLGAFQGQVVSVEPRTLVLQSGEKNLRVSLGQTLQNGKQIGSAQAVSAEATSEPEVSQDRVREQSDRERGERSRDGNRPRGGERWRDGERPGGDGDRTRGERFRRSRQPLGDQ